MNTTYVSTDQLEAMLWELANAGRAAEIVVRRDRGRQQQELRVGGRLFVAPLGNLDPALIPPRVPQQRDGDESS